MRFDPKDAAQIIPAGEYDAEVLSAEEKITKTSNKPMLKLVFKIFSGSSEAMLNDYIVVPETVWKLKRLCEAAGVEGFDSGEVNTAKLVGKGVRLKIKVKPATEKYPESNSVAGYAKIGGETASDDLAIPEENIPF